MQSWGRCYSSSDVTEMHTVRRSPESAPRPPDIAHQSFPSSTDHHVECCTVVVARCARRSDWERLSGRWEATSKDVLSAPVEALLFVKRSKSACDPRSQARTLCALIESLRPRAEIGVEGGESHITCPGRLRSIGKRPSCRRPSIRTRRPGYVIRRRPVRPHRPDPRKAPSSPAHGPACWPGAGCRT